MDFSKSLHLKRKITDFDLSQRPIGRGQFGSVYLCVEKTNGKQFAIKLLESPTDDEVMYKQFTREVTIQSQVKHPAIIPLYCWGENCSSPIGDVSFIMSPYMKNKSLDEFIDEEKIKELSPTKRMIIIYGIALGMKFLHGLGVIHRDLKPGNVLLDELYRPFIADFGFSKFTPKGTTPFFSIRPGTPLYTAPELLEEESESLSEKVDVYSFGVIVFNVLTGLQFSKLKSIFRLSEYVLKGNRPNIPEDVPNFYKELIQQCWDKSPDHRPSFEEIVSKLEEKDNILPGAHKSEFSKYMNYVKKVISENAKEEEKKEELEVKEEDSHEPHSMPLPTFNLSFRGYPPTSLSKSQDFSKFIAFYFEFEEEEIDICLGKNIIIGDAKIVISIEKMIPPSYLKLTFNGRKLNESGLLSLIKTTPINRIRIEVIKDLSDLPSDPEERELEVENEIHAQVNLKTTRLILREGNKTGVEPLDTFHNFFVCGKSLSLFHKCLEQLC